MILPVPDSSPVQASVAPVAPVPESKVNSVVVEQESPVLDAKLREPRVVLSRIRPEVSRYLLKNCVKVFDSCPVHFDPIVLLHRLDITVSTLRPYSHSSIVYFCSFIIPCCRIKQTKYFI